MRKVKHTSEQERKLQSSGAPCTPVTTTAMPSTKIGRGGGERSEKIKRTETELLVKNGVTKEKRKQD